MAVNYEVKSFMEQAQGSRSAIFCIISLDLMFEASLYHLWTKLSFCNLEIIKISLMFSENGLFKLKQT